MTACESRFVCFDLKLKQKNFTANCLRANIDPATQQMTVIHGLTKENKSQMTCSVTSTRATPCDSQENHVRQRTEQIMPAHTTEANIKG